MRILVIGGISRSLVNFRGPLLSEMVKRGHEVHSCAGEVQADVVEKLEQMGVRFHPVEIERRGTSVLGDWQYYKALREVIGQVHPDVVLSYTVKPVVYGSIAAGRARTGRVGALITGAGAAQPGTTWKESVIATIARRLYRVGLRYADVVYFQNPDDEAMFRQYRLLAKRSHVVQIPGSGVDLDHFSASEPVAAPVSFLLIARLLLNKGIREFAEAARTLRERYGDRVRFVLVGGFESGGGGVPQHEVRGWQEQGTIEYAGPTYDVRPYLAQCSVYVLPSWREGTPRTVLEAMATGRAIITTDAPGCRETVVEGENGYLVPPKDAAALAEAMERFVADPALITRMGLRSREIAEDKYDVHKVNRVILDALGL